MSIEEYAAEQQRYQGMPIYTQAEMNVVKLALWLARADRAKDLFNRFVAYMKAGLYGLNTDCLGEFDTSRKNKKTPYQWCKIWAAIEQKCIEMAIKYKEDN